MSMFGDNTLRQELFDGAEYQKAEFNVNDREIIRALLDIVDYYLEYGEDFNEPDST